MALLAPRHIGWTIYRTPVGFLFSGSSELESLREGEAYSVVQTAENTVVSSCMSSAPVTRAEFDRLSAEVRALTTLLQGLTLRGAPRENSPSGISSASFELVSGGVSSAGESLAAAASDLSAERIAVANGIGAWVKRCLVGQLRGLSGREKIGLASKYYLVFRSIDSVVHNPPLVFSTWRDTKSKVFSPEGQPGDSIFIGLPTKAEARLVVQAADFEEPTALRRQQ